MIKRLISGSLAFILSFLMSASAYAETPEVAERIKFLAAVKSTFDEVKREDAIAKKYSDVSEVIDNLAQRSYEFLLEAAMNMSDDEDEMSVSFKNVLLADNAGGKILNTVEADVGQIIGMSAKVGASFYVDGDKLAVRLPGVNPSYYYYIKADTTADQWNNAAIGAYLPMTQDDLDALKSYMELFKNNGESLAAKPPKDIADKYAALTAKLLSGGRFRSEGNSIVEANRGRIATEKISCQISAAALNNYMYELADTIENDQQLRDYLKQLYAGMNDLGYDMDEDLIDTLTGFLRSGSFDTGVKYNVYISGTGYAARQELVYEQTGENGSTYNVVWGLNLLGKDFLLNETKLTLDTTGEFEQASFSADIIGDVVPKNGVFEYKIICRNVYKDSGAGEDTSAAFIDFKWDTNKTADNFMLNLAYKDLIDNEAMTIAKTDSEAARFKLAGSVTLDKAGSVFAGDFKDITAEYGGASLSFDLKFSFKPANPAAVSIPENRAVDILRLTDAELEAITAQVMSAFGL